MWPVRCTDLAACLVLDPLARLTLTVVNHTFAVPVSAGFLLIQEKREPVVGLPPVFTLGCSHTCFKSRSYSSWVPSQNQVTTSSCNTPNAR